MFWNYTESKIKKICFSPKVRIQRSQSLIQPLLEPFEHNLGQNSSIKRLFQPTLWPISAFGFKSAQGN